MSEIESIHPQTPVNEENDIPESPDNNDIIPPEPFDGKEHFAFLQPSNQQLLTYPNKEVVKTIIEMNENEKLLHIPHEKDPKYEWYCYSADLQILRDTRNGMFNARSILVAVNSTKASSNGNKWFTLEKTKEMIKGFCTLGGFKEEELMINVTNVPVEFRGWYLHELLVEHYAIWASVEYAYKISLLLKKIREEERDRLAEQAREFEDQIKYLTDKQKEFIFQIQELEKKNNETQTELDETYQKLQEKQDEIAKGIQRLKEAENLIKRKDEEFKNKGVSCEVTEGYFEIRIRRHDNITYYYGSITKRSDKKNKDPVYFRAIYTSSQGVRESLRIIHHMFYQEPLIGKRYTIVDLDATMDLLLNRYQPKQVFIDMYSIEQERRRQAGEEDDDFDSDEEL